MIGKGSSISSTLGAMRYGNNQEKDAEMVYSDMVIGDSPEEISAEFGRIQELNRNCERDTLSFVLSPTVEDGKDMDRQELERLTKQFIKEMKLEGRQAVAYSHSDKDHKHVHLYVNRIDMNGRAYNDSFIGKRAQLAAERTAREVGIKTVRDVQRERSMALGPITRKIQQAHEQVMRQEPKTVEQYMERMKEREVIVEPYINRKKELQGFRFEYQGHSLKGSEVSRSMGAGNLLRNMEHEKGVELAGRTVSLNPSLARSVIKRAIKIVMDQGIGI